MIYPTCRNKRAWVDLWKEYTLVEVMQQMLQRFKLKPHKRFDQTVRFQMERSLLSTGAIFEGREIFQ